jgi:hypothetical protein
MQRACSLSLSVPPHTPAVTMDHRVEPVVTRWVLFGLYFASNAESSDRSARSKDESKFMPLHVAEFEFRHNDRENADIFGTAIARC